MPILSKLQWFKQFAILVIVICAIGFCATYFIYRQAQGTTTASTRAFFTMTAVQTAHFIKDSGANLSEGMPNWSLGVTRVRILRQDAEGNFVDRGNGQGEALRIELSSEAEEAVKSQVPVVSEVLRSESEIPVRSVYVPLDATSLAIVDIDEQVAFHQQSDLDQSFRAAILVICLLSVVFSMFLSGSRWLSFSAFKLGLGRLPAGRTWITIGLIVASIALLFDGANGYSQISQAGNRGREAAEVLTVCNKTSLSLTFIGPTMDRLQIESSAKFFRDSGEIGLSELATDLLAQEMPDEGLVSLFRLRIDDLENKSLGILHEANSAVKNENRAQSFRLVFVVVLAVFALMLMNAISAKEREIEQTLDESSLAKLEYQSMIGNLPIGLFAFSGGSVVFSNGAWDVGSTIEPDEVIEQVLEGDREALLESLRKSESEHTPFAGAVRVRTQGSVRSFETFGAPVVDSEGQLKRVLVFCIDVTQMLYAKEEISKKHKEVEEKNYQLRAAITHIEGALETFVETIVRAVESRDPYTAGHSNRVGQYSKWIGMEMGLSDFDLRTLANGALCHDVGKIGIPDHILLKPEKLTREEFAIIQEHPTIGARILGEIGLFRNSLPIVKWHHERLDGTGYPDGLSGEEIPLLVRIVAVADVFDALTSSRSYRGKSAVQAALSIMNEEVAAGKLDPTCFNCLQQAIDKHGTIPQVEAA